MGAGRHENTQRAIPRNCIPLADRLTRAIRIADESGTATLLATARQLSVKRLSFELPGWESDADGLSRVARSRHASARRAARDDLFPPCCSRAKSTLIIDLSPREDHAAADR